MRHSGSITLREKSKPSTLYTTAVPAAICITDSWHMGNFSLFAKVLERIAVALGIEVYELFAVKSSPESSMERLHKDIIKEIRQVIVEELEKALADKHQN
uniref:Uncharacterized protein n=1 Tax=uncultured bacterium contig00011 TaxID=1181503 RepID=A0A806KLU7_9BACT|nr:hypothetical protein [uncultured bacterium contig00011]